MAISRVPVMVNAALLCSYVKLIFRFQVWKHCQQADPFLTKLERERGRGRHTVPHNFLLFFCWHTRCCLWVHFPLASLSSSNECPLNFVPLHLLFILSFLIPICLLAYSPPCFSQFHFHSKMWLEVTRHQTVPPSGPDISIWRGCWLFWHGEGTHTSLASSGLIVCVCFVFFACICVSVHPSNSFYPPFLSSTSS